MQGADEHTKPFQAGINDRSKRPRPASAARAGFGQFDGKPFDGKQALVAGPPGSLDLEVRSPF